MPASGEKRRLHAIEALAEQARANHEPFFGTDRDAAPFRLSGNYRPAPVPWRDRLRRAWRALRGDV